MKIVILGAGLAGVASAWFLAKDGHDVCVVDREPDVSLGASFANGGHLSTGDIQPWAGPELPPALLKSFLSANAPFRLRPGLSASYWRFVFQLLRNSSHSRNADATRKLLPLAALNRKLLSGLRESLTLDYYSQTGGALHLLSAPEDGGNLPSGQPLSPEACLRLEPALRHAVESGRIGGGLFFPDDETGDARRFACALAGHARKKGAAFFFGAPAAAKREKNRIAEIYAGTRRFPADAVILALGTGSAAFARSLGLRLPVRPVHGYSVTMRTQGNAAPLIGLADRRRRIVVSRLGGKLRIAGLADFSPAPHPDPARRWRVLREFCLDLLPGSVRPETAENWTAARPMTPDGLPLLGQAAGIDNLWLNTGHGSSGWTLCLATAQLTADLIAGRTPPLDPAPFSLARFSPAAG